MPSNRCGRELTGGFDSRPLPREEIGEPGGRPDPSPIALLRVPTNCSNVVYLEAALWREAYASGNFSTTRRVSSPKL